MSIPRYLLQPDIRRAEDVVTSGGAKVSIRVAAPPTVVTESVVVTENQSGVASLSGNDREGVSLRFSIATGPSHGTLRPVTPARTNTAQVNYTPSPNYIGLDSFTYKASDGIQTSSPASINRSSAREFVEGGGGIPPREM